MAEKCIDGATRLLEEADTSRRYAHGMREAAYLMNRPADGWESRATKADVAATRKNIDLRFDAVDARFDALEHRLRADFREQTTRLLLWIVPTIFAGIAALGAIVAATS